MNESAGKKKNAVECLKNSKNGNAIHDKDGNVIHDKDGNAIHGKDGNAVPGKPGSGHGGRMRGLAAVLASVFLLGTLTGCSHVSGGAGGMGGEKGYSRSEIMVIAMTEKNRYEEVCTDEIWKVSLGEEGESFESYLTAQIKSFMEELKVMSLLAEERELSLSAQERADMAAAAQEYFDALTPEDIEYMGVTLEDVQQVYEDYCMAEKLVEELTADLNLEVSDSEAKVISFQQISTSDRAAAESVREAAAAENGDFQKSAEAAGLTVSTRYLGRLEETEEFEEAAFSLETGQVSPVVEKDGLYYVLCCVSDYEEEETQARKKVIFEERKRKAFRDIYDSFCGGVELTYSDGVWEELELASGSYGSGADFFEIYRKYAG